LHFKTIKAGLPQNPPGGKDAPKAPAPAKDAPPQNP